VLKHILRRAYLWKDADGDRYLRHYPLQDLKRLKEPKGRVRFLVDDELPRLLGACADSRSPYLTPFMLVSINTGMRRGEILHLERKDINWTRRTANLRETKNGESRIVHLNDSAIEALRSLPVRIDGRLFPFADDAVISRSFRRACARAAVHDFRLHDLRHHFASAQAMVGTSTRILQALLGHKDSRMTMRYSHLSENTLEQAVNKINIGPASGPIPNAVKA
jgi:integrase